MDISFAKCQTIMDTLPIGYYTGRRIKTSLDKDTETSFYSPSEDTIVVSYPIIAERMKNMPEGGNEEEAVRSMLYHEVSHAILTPTTLSASTPVNIFEDERIESKLRHYYHGVNFRKQLYDLHGGKVPVPQNADQAFFNAVRFGVSPANIQEEITRLMNKYTELNRVSPQYDYNGKVNSNDYRRDVYRLYEMIEREFEKNPNAFQTQDGQGQQKNMDSCKSNKSTSKSSGNKGEKKEQKSFAGQEDQSNEGTEERPANIADERLEEMSAEDVKRMVGACLGKAPDLSKFEQEKLDSFQKTAEMIIGNFNRKNRGGSGINTYSGVFNPRAVARQDYRFFERAMTTQGNNKFGTCHLNLIIDCSGSYEENVPLTNGILAVLSEIERKNRNFSMDVIFMNHLLHPCETVRDRHMKAWGGNSVPDNMKEVLMKLQKPQTCNYNIVLFDGDAMCNNHDLRSDADYCKRFGVFDMKQTTLISDPDNEPYMKNFSSTKIVITRNYTSELIKHITNALTIAFG